MSRFERWTRHFLENQARKHGVTTPEAEAQPTLVRKIVQHQVAAASGLRDQARKLLQSLVAGAAAAPALLKNAASAARPLLQTRTASLAEPAPAYDPPRVSANETGQLTALYLRQPAQPTAAQPTAPSQLSIERNQAELQLSWQVSEDATARARALLGQPGELALRVVSVRADPAQVVVSETSEHGPVAANGAWTLLLPSADAHCVGAVGLRHGERFVSIVHESSRAPEDEGVFHAEA